ncbi:MAG: hypothetical protein JNM10_08360 [Planctomycetia bacterium]|nr:hypothetical protein [Planctomycetia bacterium]
MGAFRAWCRKELREQRRTLLLGLVVVALGTAVPFVAFPDATAPRDLHPFPGYAVALVGVVVGSRLFARDLGAAHALVLRTPGALRAALPAKLLVLGLACALALGVEEAVRHGLSAMTGVPDPYARLGPAQRFVVGLWPAETRVPRLTAPIELYGVPMPIASVLAALVATTWSVLGSVLSHRVPGALTGGLLLATAAAPFLVMHGLEPGWFAFPATTSVPAIVGVAGFALVLATIAWRWGRVSLHATRRTALRVALVGAPFVVAASVGTASAIDTWRTPDPSWPDLCVENADLGTGESRLYLTVSRGCSSWSRAEEFGTERRLPAQAWIVRVEDGALRDARVGVFVRVPGTSDEWFAPTPWTARSPNEQRWTVLADDQLHWIRGGDDEATYVARHGTRNAETVAAARGVARAFAPVRLPDGRRVYGVFGGVEREGDEAPSPVHPGALVSGSAHVLADGAFRVFRDGRRYEVLRVQVDAEGVTEARALAEPESDDGGSETVWLSATEVLWRSWPAGADLAALPPWERVRLRSASAGAGAVEQRVPQPDLIDVEVAKPGTLLLHRRGADGRRTLRLWDLATDAERAVDAETSLLDGFVEVRAHGRAAEDAVVLEFRPCALGIECASSLALLTISTGRIERLTPPGRYRPVALEASGAFLVIEDGRRVVRFARGGTRREVVFPRR